MTHVGEDALILLHYGELGVHSPEGRHVEECERCRRELAVLAKDLGDVDGALVVPRRGEDYGAAVFDRIESRLEPGSRERTDRSPIHPAWLAAAAAILVATFLAGRLSLPPDAAPPAAEAVRERVLLVALGDHLDRSQLLLLEVLHGDYDEDKRAVASELVRESRLYRISAGNTLEPSTAEVLDELERLLLDVAHRASETETVRGRIDDRDVLFKIRVLKTAVEERARTPETHEF